MRLLRKVPKDKSVGLPFYTKDGFLTTYSFRCGYLEIYETAERVETASGHTDPAYKVEIWQDSSVFVVTMYHKRRDLQTGSKTEYFDTLAEARERVKDLRHEISQVNE